MANIKRLDEMSSEKKQTLGRYKGGKTLEIPYNNSSGLLSIAEAQALLGIIGRTTINEYRKALSLFTRDYINWDELREILCLQIFLGLKHGYNSKEMYLLLRDKGMIAGIFANYDINIEERFRRIQSDYHKRQRQAQDQR